MDWKNKIARGFTIIELIVVIAIIAVLASIVTAAVTKYIKSSKRSAILDSLGKIPVVATKFYEENSNYNSFCGDPEIVALISLENSYCGAGAAGCVDPSNYYYCQQSGRWYFAGKIPHPVSGNCTITVCYDSLGNRVENTPPITNQCRCGPL